MHYSTLIEEAAASVLAGLPRRYMAGIELDDLKGAGAQGAIKGVENYYKKPRHGRVSGYIFKYAVGAMRQYLKAMDWVPNEVRKSGEAVTRITRAADQTKAEADAPSMVETAAGHDSIDPAHRETIEQLAEGLEPQQREILAMHWFGGLGIPQIAMRMRMTEDSAIALQQSTVVRLRERYEYEELVELLQAN